MATFGKIDEFQPDRETLSVYVERFELFAAANNVAEARTVSFCTGWEHVLVVAQPVCTRKPE